MNRGLIYLGLVLATIPARADEPPRLPPPKVVEAFPALPPPERHGVGPTMPGGVVLPYHRVSAYAVWDYYAVDRRGRFRPRIIDTPYGAFRAVDGMPYPWVSTNSRYLMPYASE